LVFLPTGCGDNADAYMKDQIKLETEIVEALESAKDKDSAEKAKAKIEDLSKKFRDLGERWKKLNLSADQSKKMHEKYKDEADKIKKRMEEVKERFRDNDEVKNIIIPALEKLALTQSQAFQ